ncbi:lysylphosphatidylglycerol synthase transmembrane domain-containing protein [Nakamurella lactea]|uniref:lysylphosphatidylglycerol synthase transmembrane domain-containing protein n=1 Tax=Nakamurella lactea TaxID=459515 RepID=UPI000689194D|nr:lysylphosphatidylglycerol synthase transmembrane domain-containing protein [Nakamurella lactea]
MSVSSGAAPPDAGGKTHPHRWQLVLRIAALVVVAVIVAAVLRSKFPDPAQFWDALRSADWRWTVAALGLQIASIGMMIRQQRRLLKAFGVPVSFRRMGAITYSGSAISMSVPAGSAVSAGYVYRKFRSSGASSATAASVLLLSGVISVVALVLLYLAGLLITSWTHLRQLGYEHPFITVWIGGAVLAAIIGLTIWLTRQRRRSLVTRETPRLDAFEVRHPKLGAAGRQVLDAVHRSAEVPAWDWNVVLSHSLANWLLDAASLYAAAMAFDLDIDLWKLALLYLGIQVVRQIPVTPGGIGLIEASLLAGLVSAGAAQGPAAAAVVVYRLFSCWLLIPVGFGFMGVLAYNDRRNGVTEPTESEETMAIATQEHWPSARSDRGGEKFNTEPTDEETIATEPIDELPNDENAGTPDPAVR